MLNYYYLHMIFSLTSNIFIPILLSIFIAVSFRIWKNAKTTVGSSNVAVASIAELQGPASPSWLAGHFPLFFKPQSAGEGDELLIRKFGLVSKIKLALNTNALYIADPKALQYVLNTSGYNFHKRDTAKVNTIFLGPGNIIAVDGEEHARQRKILLPSFSQSHLQEIVPAFTQTTDKVVEQWNELIAAKQGEGVDIDLHTWLSRLTLDALGQSVLSYDFGALSDAPSEYVGAFRGLFVEMFKNRTDAQLAMGSLLGRLPLLVGRFLISSSVREFGRFKHFISISSEIATSLITREKEAARLGESQGKDLLSTLIRANASEDPKSRLSDDELVGQLHTFIVAGHDTTSSTLQWVFYELALHPEAQVKIREEIQRIKEVKGVEELGAPELDLLHYTAAVLKETLRLYPIALYIPRRAAREDIIPLAYPVKTTSGREVQAVHIKKGQEVLTSLYGYNRIEDLWGPDTDKWIPERFLNEGESERSKRTLGVYSHLATFSSGVHACIGWRFAVLEMQAIVAGLVEHFEFSLGTSNPIIMKKLATTMYPSVDGEEDRGAQMPLFIRPIS